MMVSIGRDMYREPCWQFGSQECLEHGDTMLLNEIRVRDKNNRFGRYEGGIKRC